VPKLRFKEFSGEWEEKSINDLLFYTNGGSFESKITDDGQYNLITLNSIDINGELKSTHKTINNANTFLNKNDLVMVLSDVAHGNFLGLTAIIPNNNQYVLNQRMGGLRLKKENNIQFIRYFINLNQKYFKTHGHGSSQQNLSKNDILKFIVKVPKDPQEQQKIADTLSSLDNLIEANSKKVEALKEHKKGLMQQLFPTDDGKVPKLRFKEFSGEWEEKKLGEVCEIYNGGTPKTSNKDYWNGKINWITPSEMGKNKYIYHTNRKITELGLKKCNTKLLPKKSIILSCRAPIGYVAINQNTMSFNQGCKGITSEKLYNEFLYYLLIISKNKLENLGSGNTFKELSTNNLKNLKILIPKSPQEQQKIADTLSSLDNLIENQSKKVEALKEHKKGLMQQIFVSEEI